MGESHSVQFNTSGPNDVISDANGEPLQVAPGANQQGLPAVVPGGTPAIAPAAPAAPAAAPAPGITRPAWLPAKFATPEAMAQAYGQLEARMGATPPAPAAAPAVPPVGTAPPVATPPAPGTPATGLSSATLQPFSEEFARNGQLSEASYGQLSQMGLARDIVDGYIQGQHTIAEESFRKVQEAAGGAQPYNEMIGWAQRTLNPQEIGAYNQAVSGGDLQGTLLAVQGLKARFDVENGQQPELISGLHADFSGLAGFGSAAEMTAAMRDPKYKTDPAYRKQVSDRVARSSF